MLEPLSWCPICVGEALAHPRPTTRRRHENRIEQRRGKKQRRGKNRPLVAKGLKWMGNMDTTPWLRLG
jgi:hypothetical protein